MRNSRFLGIVRTEALAAMTAAVAHRGLTTKALELVDTPQFGGAVGLGHRRLSIIDLSTGISPCGTPIARARSCSAAKSTTIVTCATTSRAGARGFSRPRTPRSSSKAGVSKASVPKLEGMFAFAIWDLRAEWIWRDRWGSSRSTLSQPMPGTIAFASEIKPLLGLTANRAVNLRVLYEYLLYSWCPGPQTIFEDIRHLEPGHLVRWKPNDGDIRPRRYCGIDGELGSVRPTDLTDAVRSEFDRSVADHMIADVPVGLTLSGGLDSSCVLASMARLRDPSDIDAFTIGLASPTTRRRSPRRWPSMRSPPPRSAGWDRISADFARLVRVLEEPIAHPVLQTTFEAARLPGKSQGGAHREGPDELFLGYPQCRTLKPPLSLLPASRGCISRSVALCGLCATGKHDRARIPGP